MTFRARNFSSLKAPAAIAVLGLTLSLVSSVPAFSLATAVVGPTAAVAAPPAGALAALNYSPTTRTLAPVRIQGTSGTVTNPTNVISGTDTRLNGQNSYVVLDFGREVGGTATLSFHGTSNAAQSVGLAFSESSLYVGPSSDASNGGGGADGSIVLAAPTNGSVTMSASQLRGGFRYLTVFLQTTGWVDLYQVSLNYTPAPGMADPSAYANYFYSNDTLLNRIWYAGAHTVQTNTIAPDQGRVWGPPSSGWNNSATVGVGASVLVDGAKRDRTIWPGDMGIAVPTAYVSTNDMASTRNSLQTMYNVQIGATGELPYAGPQVNFYGSDTYHMWTLAGTATYVQYTNDKAWLDSVWSKYKLGVQYISSKIGGNGLLQVTGTADWARDGQGGENIAANAILYSVLMTGATLAGIEGDAALASTYTTRAATLKAAANARLWDPAVSMYRDNPSSTLYPQDGNSLAVMFGLTDSAAKATAITGNLVGRWNAFGATTPEKGGNIGTFPGSMEVLAHFVGGDDQRGLELIRREWGYMLNSPIGTESTFWEGYKADGSFDYNGSYMSLSHGWATGPTSALTFYVLGISPDESAGNYHFVPHPGDLTSVEGRITLPQGQLNASWSRNIAAGTFTQQFTSPAGTTGTIGIPKLGGANVVVSTSGGVVWSGGVFTARPGINGAFQDENYIYLTGVTPGSYAVTASGVGLPAELPSGFTQCAVEAGTCAFTGTRVVAYGAGNYRYRTATTSSPCTATAFGGDPISGVLKSCYVAPIGGPSTFTSCASEGGTCNVTAPTRVAYGLNGAFTYLTVTAGSVACTNSAFGSDPIFGVAKSCFQAPTGGPPGGWVQCAAENASCSSVAGQPVAYGARGAFSYTPSTGNVNCSNSAFAGDPIAGVVKACYVRTGPPSGFSSTCAAENGSCSFTGSRTVAFGAAGRFVYRTFANGTACTSTAFGVDPIFGLAKSCYLTP